MAARNAAGRNAAKNGAAVAELAALGGTAAAAASAVVDVTDEEQCRAMVAEAVRRHGRLDILVNNARRALGKQPHEFPMAEWRAVLEANLASVVMCSQAAYPEMKRVGGGRIVNVASLAAFLAMPTMAAYAPSKAGVVQFSRVCAAAWARDNIQVNAVLPGWIETDMTRPRREDAGFNERVLARVPPAAGARRTTSPGSRRSSPARPPISLPGRRSRWTAATPSRSEGGRPGTPGKATARSDRGCAGALR